MAWKATQELDSITLGNKSACISVEKDGEAFGRLQIGKATLVWRPKNKAKGHKLNWSELAELFDQHGKNE